MRLTPAPGRVFQHPTPVRTWRVPWDDMRMQKERPGSQALPMLVLACRLDTGPRAERAMVVLLPGVASPLWAWEDEHDVDDSGG